MVASSWDAKDNILSYWVVILQLAVCICGSIAMNASNCWLKNIHIKKFPESSKKQNLNLPSSGNYLHSIYIVLSIISKLEMI